VAPYNPAEGVPDWVRASRAGTTEAAAQGVNTGYGVTPVYGIASGCGVASHSGGASGYVSASGTGVPSTSGITPVSGTSDMARAQVEVRLPDNAELWFEGQRLDKMGTVRTFHTPPLERGQKYAYEVRARWKEGGKMVERTCRVVVRAGQRSTLDILEDEEASGS